MSGLKHFQIIILLLPFSVFAQDTLSLSREESEAIFLKENLQLMAQKLEIPQAEAMLAQAKLWPNPTLELEEVNFWTNNRLQDELPAFSNGSFGKNQQVAVSIEQLIYTAGKRKKLVALEQVSADQSKEYFEELLRNLKIEFRNQLTSLQYLQRSSVIYESQFTSIKKLTDAYQKQLKHGNINKGEYIRLKALELEIAKQINDLQKEANEIQKELKLLMRLPSTTILKIKATGYQKEGNSFDAISLSTLFDIAKSSRPDYKIAQLEEHYYEKLHIYEKAKRIPDLSLKAGYDRGSGIMHDFIGFGLSIDLPFFDRNQGNVRYAQLGVEQAKLNFQEKELSIENEIVMAYRNLNAAFQFYEQIEMDYEATLDELLKSYTKNFINRNISIVEYLDFLDAYLENKIIILEAIKEINEKAEALNYAVGTDVMN